MKTNENVGNQTEIDELVRLKAEEAKVFQPILDKQRERQTLDREIEKLLDEVEGGRVRLSILIEERARKS